MKKILYSALAVSMLAACSQDELVDLQQPGQITFAGAFVDNATRAAADPSTTTGSIQNFDVWAFIDQSTGVVFEDEDVVKSGNAWTYSNTQYWYPNHTYYFAALSPMNSANVIEHIAEGDYAKHGLGTIDFTNVDGSEDLIYAATTVTTGADINKQPDPVKFQFNHLLSKVKFSFKNGFVNPTTQLVIRDIKMNVAKKGSINLAQADWWSTNEWALGADRFDLKFGDVARLAIGETDECAKERLTIPAGTDEVYTIKFTVDLYQGDVLAQTFEDETSLVKGVALEIGKAYNFVAEINASNLGLFPINFEVEEVKDWVNDEKFQEAIVADNEEVTLVSNGTLAETAKVMNGGILDGAGHTLSIDNTFRYLDIVEMNNGATVKNLTIEGTTTNDNVLYALRANSGGVYNIDNVVVNKLKNSKATYTLNINTTQDVTLNVSNSTFCGWNSFGPSTTATFTNVNFVGTYEPDYAIFKPHGTATLSNCRFAQDYYLDLTTLAAGEILTFNNCYVGGVLLTADNIKALFGTVEDYDKKKNQVVVVPATTVVDLANAIASAKTGDVIRLGADITLSETIEINKAITLDLNGKKVTSTAKKAFEVYANATIENGTIEAANRCVDTRKAVELTLNNVTLIADKYTPAYGNPQVLTIGGSENGTKVNMSNVTINKTAGYGIITFVKTQLTATKSNISGYNALYVKPGSEGSTFNFAESTLSGSTVGNDVEGNAFSTIAVRADNVTVNVDDKSTVNATGNYCNAMSMGGSYAGEESTTGVTVKVLGTINGNILAGFFSGNTVKVNADYAAKLGEEGYAVSYNNDDTVTVTGEKK